MTRRASSESPEQRGTDVSFLHHEELYHSTPETQTDESYTHPEGG